MEITGILHKILPIQTGTGSKGSWKKQEFVIKTKGSYPTEVAITAWGDKCDLVPGASKVGQEITAHVNPRSKPINDKFYGTELILWKIDY